jgi:sugar (pentulose or hexulose) kinase
MECACAVIDIGMTNKKIVIFDETLSQIDMVSKTFPPVTINHRGTELETHDLAGMEKWFFEKLKTFAARYPVKAIAVSAHGASFVCIDETGKVCAPCIFYTHEPGEDFQEEFYAVAGTREYLQRTTYTPPLSAMINPAKGIFFLQKNFPHEFKRTKTLLNLPQYWSFVLTGITGIEPTYLGVHNYLWNHAAQSYSSVVDTLGIRKLLPKNYKNTCESIGPISSETALRTGLAPDTLVTMGIHDSNASLLPYLSGAGAGDFVLNSTGTWCVLMHPQEDFTFNPGDIGNIVFFNQSVLGKPVKTAIFLGGMEFDVWTGLFKSIGKSGGRPVLTSDALRNFIVEKDCFLLPELVSGSGQFSTSKSGIFEKGIFYSTDAIRRETFAPAGLSGGSWRGTFAPMELDGDAWNGAFAPMGKLPPVMQDGVRFYAALTLSLVIQTITGARRAGLREGSFLYTEGGFRRDREYNTLLASVLTKNRVFLTDMKEATASGAAMTALMAYTGRKLEELGQYIRIEKEEIPADSFPGIEDYIEEWIRLSTAGETERARHAAQF